MRHKAQFIFDDIVGVVAFRIADNHLANLNDLNIQGSNIL